MCDAGFAREYFPEAAAYGGDPGPHIVEIFERQDALRDNSYRSVFLFSGPLGDPIPEYWHGADDPKAVQVVACAERVDQAEQVKTCDFDSPEPNVPMYRAMYEVILYEARTGNEVVRFSVPGNGTGCPASIVYFDYEDPELFTSLTFEDYRHVLGRYVDG